MESLKECQSIWTKHGVELMSLSLVKRTNWMHVIIWKCQCYLMQPAIPINGFFHISFNITFTMIDISICLNSGTCDGDDGTLLLDVVFLFGYC